MAKLESQQEFFAAADGGAPASAAGGRLRLVGTPGRPLTKAQKKFDRLLRKVETLRAEKARMTARWDKFVKVYQERIHPEERRMIERRKQVVRLLAEHWRKPKGLGKRQREQLADLLITQMRALAESGPETLDEDLRTLWDELHPPRPESAGDAVEIPKDGNASTEEAAIPREIAELIEDLGLDPTLFKPGMTPEDFLRETERQIHDRYGGAEESGTEESPRPKSARQEAAERKAAERAALREEARKRTVMSIYKQLAKLLHPDLEQDPALRERKHALMQELTKAHREGDLHTLLRLELEWVKREEGDLERLGDEKLGIYSELLEEQVEELQAEVRDVAFSPRFAVVARFSRPFGDGPGDVESILLSIRRMSESLKGFRDEMSGPGAKQVLREALQEMAAVQRRQAAFRNPFKDGF